MIRFILMVCGYAENASVSSLIYQSGFHGRSGYDTYQEAITDLALDMYAKFYEEYLNAYENRYSKDVKICCRNSLIDNNEANFCSVCGNQIADKSFDAEEFMEYVSGLHKDTCDSYGDAEYAGGRNLTWYPYWVTDFIGAPREEVVCIAESAEAVLLAALLEAKLELCEGNESYINNRDWQIFKTGMSPSYT